MSLNFAVLGIWGARCGLGLGDAREGDGVIIVFRDGMRDTGLGIGFRGICPFLQVFLIFWLFLMTLGSRGARSASRDSKLSLGLRILSIFKVLNAEEIGLAFRLVWVSGL